MHQWRLSSYCFRLELDAWQLNKHLNVFSFACSTREVQGSASCLITLVYIYSAQLVQVGDAVRLANARCKHHCCYAWRLHMLVQGEASLKQRQKRSLIIFFYGLAQIGTSACQLLRSSLLLSGSPLLIHF